MASPNAAEQAAGYLSIEDMSVELLAIDQWYGAEAARVNRMAEMTGYGYAQGHEFGNLLEARAHNASDTPLGSRSRAEVLQGDERLLGRRLLSDAITDAARFLDVDPQIGSADMSVIVRPLPYDSDLTHAIVDELEATLQAEPIDERGQVFHTALTGVYLRQERVLGEYGDRYLGLSLHRVPDHENLLSQSGYPRENAYRRSEAKLAETQRREAGGYTPTIISERPVDTSYQDTQTMVRPIRHGAHRRTSASTERKPEHPKPIDGPTGEYFTTLAHRLRENTGSSIELDRLEDRVREMGMDQRHTFTGDTDVQAERAVRLNVERAAVSAAAFLAPSQSGRMPVNVQLLKVPLHELRPVTRSDDTVRSLQREIGTLFGVTEHGEAQMIRNEDGHMFSLSEQTMFPGITLNHIWRPDEHGGRGQFEVWLDREQPVSL